MLFITLVVGAFCLYMLPSIVAAFTKTRHGLGIVLVNFFFGWTIIVWVLCFVWAIIPAPYAKPTTA